MRILLHHPLSAASRAARIALAEKRLPFELDLERPWEASAQFVAMDPACDLPLLVDSDGSIITSAAVLEYLEDRYPDPPLLGDTVLQRAEVRRLVAWFERRFAREVTDALVGERAWKRLSGGGHPDTATIRAGLSAIRHHLDHIGWLAERRTWLAGPRLSLADCVAAAHLSAIDYLGDIAWDAHPEAKDWYARVKSRPSVRAILTDAIPGMIPPKHYADPDF